MADINVKAQDKAVATESKAGTGGDIDRVAMASRLPDGTPHQTPDYEYLDEEFAASATKRQLTEQAVSAADSKVRAEQTAPEADDGKLSEDQQALQDAHDKAYKAAEARAASETKSK